jgi:U4/U6 small nuclear ribonucleoprotein PRP3
MGSSSGAATINNTLCAVYRVQTLAHGQHRFKVDVNAKENHMSGVCVRQCAFKKQ